MPRPAMRLRILPRFPAQVQATAPVVVTKTAGTYSFTADYRPIGENTTPALGTYAVLLQDQTTGSFVRTLLTNLPTGSTDWTLIQNRPAKIDALATLDTSLGAVEQTGPNTFVKRTIGGGLSASLVTYGDAATLYQPLNARLTSISSTGVATADIINSAVTFAKVQNFASAGLFGASAAGVGGLIAVGAGLTLSGGTLSSSAVAATGSVINSVYAEYTSNATISTAIPLDNTIPQNTEGVQILSASITPSATANKVRVHFVGYGGNSAGVGSIISALFRGAGANAICSSVTTTGGANHRSVVAFSFEDSPATTSATTYTIRVGPNTGSMALNGVDGVPNLGGSSRAIILLEEIKG